MEGEALHVDKCRDDDAQKKNGRNVFPTYSPVNIRSKSDHTFDVTAESVNAINFEGDCFEECRATDGKIRKELESFRTLVHFAKCPWKGRSHQRSDIPAE
jgi:hypothetical protein